MRSSLICLALGLSLILAGCSNKGPNIERLDDPDVGNVSTGTSGAGGTGSGPTGTGGAEPADNPAAGVSNQN